MVATTTSTDTGRQAHLAALELNRAAQGRAALEAALRLTLIVRARTRGTVDA